MKNRKIIILVLIIFLVCIFLGLTGVTFSYFQNTGQMKNLFQAGDFSTSIMVNSYIIDISGI